MKYNNESELYNDIYFVNTKHDNTTENSENHLVFENSLLKCITAIYRQAALSGISNYLVFVEKHITDNSDGNSNITFAQGTDYNKDIYDIVSNNCKIYQINNYDFIISKNDNKNLKYEETKCIDNSKDLSDDDFSQNIIRLLYHGDYFKYVTVSNTNQPYGNLSDYLLIKQFIDNDNST